MAAKRDYYEILGLSKSATADEIKRAYRKLALQHHPDRHGGDDSQFKELSEAYEILKDPKKRSAYDQFGHTGGPFGASGTGGGAAYGGGFQGFGGAEGFDFSDILNQFMGGSPFAGGRAGGPPRGRDLEVAVTIDLVDAVFGVTKEISLNMDDNCSHCGGNGAEPGTSLKSCPNCKGKGQVTRVTQTILGAMQQTSTCPNCNGRGQIPETPCHKCHGTGVERRQVNLSVKVPPGADNGTTLRLSGKGAAASGGVTKGDLYVLVRVSPDKRFKRSGKSILSDVSLPMVDAALGTEVPVETVDGPVHLKVPAGTQSGKVFKLSGRGIPSLGGRTRGDQLVTVTVETPSKLTSRQRQLLEEFAQAEPTKKGFFHR